MIASKGSKRTSLMVLLTALPLTAVPVIAYTYTWIGGSAGAWDADDGAWTRTGCGSPCNEYPGTGDDAVIPESVAFGAESFTSDDLSVVDAEVRFGPTGTGYCTELDVYTFDSISISATSGNSAQLRGGHCVDLVTN